MSIRLIMNVQSSKYEYQYHLKDHLANVRMTFSETQSTTSTEYLATMEDEPLAIKEYNFSHEGN